MFLAEKLGEWHQGEPIYDHTEWVTLLAASTRAQYTGVFRALPANNEESIMSVAIEYKSTAGSPQMPYCPEHSLSVEFIETILCINAASDEGVINW